MSCHNGIKTWQPAVVGFKKMKTHSDCELSSPIYQQSCFLWIFVDGNRIAKKNATLPKPSSSLFHAYMYFKGTKHMFWTPNILKRGIASAALVNLSYSRIWCRFYLHSERNLAGHMHRFNGCQYHASQCVALHLNCNFIAFALQWHYTFISFALQLHCIRLTGKQHLIEPSCRCSVWWQWAIQYPGLSVYTLTTA